MKMSFIPPIFGQSVMMKKWAKTRNPENTFFLKKLSTTFSKNSLKFQI